MVSSSIAPTLSSLTPLLTPAEIYSLDILQYVDIFDLETRPCNGHGNPAGGQVGPLSFTQIFIHESTRITNVGNLDFRPDLCGLVRTASCHPAATRHFHLNERCLHAGSGV